MVMGESSSLASGFLFFYFSVAPPSSLLVSPSPLRSLACSYTHSRADHGYFMAASLGVHGSTRPARLQEIRNIQGSFFFILYCFSPWPAPISRVSSAAARPPGCSVSSWGIIVLGACSRRHGSGKNRTSSEKLTPSPSFPRLPVFVFLQKRNNYFFFLPSSPGMLCLFFFFCFFCFVFFPVRADLGNC